MRQLFDGFRRLRALVIELLPIAKEPRVDPFELPCFYLKTRFERTMPYVPEKTVYVWRSRAVPLNAEEKKKMKAQAEAGIIPPDELSLLLRVQLAEVDFHVAFSQPEATPFAVTADALSARVTDTLANRVARSDKRKRNKPDAVEESFTRQEAFDVKVKVSGDYSNDDKSLKDTLLEPDARLYLQKNGEIEKIPYAVRWIQYPLEAVSVPFLPRENFPLTALVDTKNGALDRLFADVHEEARYFPHAIRFLWYTSSEKKTVKAADLEWIETESGWRPEMADAEFRCESFSFTPTAEDVGKYICVVASCNPAATVLVGEEEGAIDRSTIVSPEWTVIGKSDAVVVAKSESAPLLAENKFEWARRDEEARKADPDPSRLRIASYNLLADNYINLSLKNLYYPFCSKNYQHVRYRYPALFRELKEYSADLYILQEVCPKAGLHYLPALFADSNHGWEFHRKYVEVREGSGMAWNNKRFKRVNSWCRWLKDTLDEEYNEDIRNLLARATPERRAFFEARPTLVHIIQLEDVVTQSPLLLANTHLHHKPSDENFKLLQTALVTREMARRVRETGARRVIFGCDLNSTPDSAAIALLQHGRVDATDAVWAAEEAMGGMELRLSDELQLQNLSGEPELTNHTRHVNEEGETKGFVGCIDYVWATGVEAIEVAPQPTIHEIARHTAMPSCVAPSDHVAIVLSARYSNLTTET